MKNNSSMGWILGIIALLVVGGGIALAMNPGDETETGTEETTSQAQQGPGTIVAVASNTASLSTLITAVKAADLVDTLQGAGPFTVFAPTNSAFNKLPTGTLDTLLKPENVDQLKTVLTYHVVPGKVMAADLKDGQNIATVQGGTLTVSIRDGSAYLVDAKNNRVMVEMADVDTDNGVVHVIGGVLLPQ